MKTYDYRKILLLLSIGLILYPLILTAKIYIKYENNRNDFSDLYHYRLPINDCCKIIEIMKEKGLKDEDFRIYTTHTFEKNSEEFDFIYNEYSCFPSPALEKGRYISIRNKYFKDMLEAIIEKGLKLHFIYRETIRGYTVKYPDDFKEMNYMAMIFLKLPYIKKCSFDYLIEDELNLFESEARNYPCAVVMVKTDHPLPKEVLEGINQLFMAYHPEGLSIVLHREVAIYNEKGRILYGNPGLIRSYDFLDSEANELKHLRLTLTDRPIRPYFYSDNTEYYICLSTFTSGIILLLILLLTWKKFLRQENET